MRSTEWVHALDKPYFCCCFLSLRFQKRMIFIHLSLSIMWSCEYSCTRNLIYSAVCTQLNFKEMLPELGGFRYLLIVINNAQYVLEMMVSWFWGRHKCLWDGVTGQRGIKYVQMVPGSHWKHWNLWRISSKCTFIEHCGKHPECSPLIVAERKRKFLLKRKTNSKFYRPDTLFIL